MKFKIILILSIVSIALISCKNKEISTEPKVIDLSSFGSVNMIKEIGGEIFVLNSTASSIHKLNGDSLSLFRDLEIGGRDFLLDFEIEGDKVYYSNTYDEIFISKGSVIEDTVRVLNPDRIAVIGSKLFVTSRKSEDGNFYLKLIDLNSKELAKSVMLNDSVQTDMEFAQVTISEFKDNLWIMNPFRSRIEVYDLNLDISDIIELSKDKEYGNLGVSENEVVILASENSNVQRIVYNRSTKAVYVTDTGISDNNIDIRSSCVSADKLFLYDFIELKIFLN